jgi:hypothetical protein
MIPPPIFSIGGRIIITGQISFISAPGRSGREMGWMGDIFSNKREKETHMIDDTTMTLIPKERLQLDALEHRIRSTLPSLSQFITLLYQINQQNLYQPHYATFKRYCAEKWAIDSRMVVMLHEMLNCLEDQGEDFEQPDY